MFSKPKRIEPGPGQESVWDYPRPPRVEAVTKTLKVIFDDTVIAETQRGKRVVETAGAPVYYFPPEDVRMEFLRLSRKNGSLCEWKGWADYYDILINERKAAGAAWTYADPNPGYESIRGFLAFYANKVDACYVDQELARPQPGGFYGGWVTDAIVGPIKGEPGSEYW